MDDSTFKMMMAVIATASSVGGLSAVWWMKKWVNKVDSSLSSVNEKVQELAVADAVSKAEKSNFNGSLSQLQKCINGTNETVGVLSASIKKLWGIVEQSPGLSLERRISDDFKDG